MLKALIAALCLVLIQVGGGYAQASMQDELAAAAEAYGADVEVVLLPEANLNAGYRSPGQYCWLFFCEVIERSQVFFLGDWSQIEPELRLAVLLHELGHYRQWLEGRPMDEWDADIYAANTLCRAGYDGIGLIERVGWLLLGTYGRSWSAGHGTKHGSWYERLSNVQLKASACRRGQEAPLWQASTISTTARAMGENLR